MLPLLYQNYHKKVCFRYHMRAIASPHEKQLDNLWVESLWQRKGIRKNFTFVINNLCK